jgi:hypothetical protein
MPKHKQEKAGKKSLGTVIAEKARAKANSFSDEKRQSLTERGMALIYSGPGYAKVDADRR